MSKAEGFAAVPNWMIREKRVPRNAVLVYASLASRSGLGGIHPSQATLAEESGLSERTVRSMLAELESLGVVQRVRRTTVQRGKGNRLPDGYTLHPNGATDLPADIAGSNVQPETGRLATGNKEGSNRQRAASHSSIEVEPVEVEPEKVEGLTFDDFWSLWPKKNAKKNAQTAWVKAVKRADASVIIDAARAYVSSPHRPELKFVPYGASWLNADRWEDPAPEPMGGRLSTVDAGRAADALLAAREQLAVGA